MLFQSTVAKNKHSTRKYRHNINFAENYKCLEEKYLFFYSESDSPKFHFPLCNWTPTDGEMDYETVFTTELPQLFLLL